MRPSLDGPALQSLLVGYAQPGGAPATQVGAGTFRLGASAVGEVAAQPATLGFGIWDGPHWHATRTVAVRNVSTRRLQVSLRRRPGRVRSTALPRRSRPVSLRAGRSAPVKRDGEGGRCAARAARHRRAPDLAARQLDVARSVGAVFRPLVREPAPHVSISDAVVQGVRHEPGASQRPGGRRRARLRLQIQPVSRLDVAALHGGGRYIGVMARLRNLLPGLVQLRDHGPRADERPARRPARTSCGSPPGPRCRGREPSSAQVSFTIE